MNDLAHFQPKVTESNGTFFLTAPHLIRDEAWDALRLVSKYKWFSQDGGQPTQITVEATAGNDPRFVYSLLVFFTYYATVSKVENADLQTLWGTSMEDHKTAIVENLNLPKNESPLTTDEIEIGLGFILTHLAKKAMRQWTNKVSGYGLREGVVRQWVDNAYESKNRLTFVNRREVKMSRREFNRRLSVCDAGIEVLENTLTKAQELNSQITAQQAGADFIIEFFLKDLKEQGLTKKTLNLYQGAVGLLTKSIEGLDQLQQVFSQEMAEEAIRNIATVVPAAS